MLAIKKQTNYLEKAVRLPNGSWAMVVFELVERDGHIIAKAVSYKLLTEVPAQETDNLYLPGVKSPAEFVPIRYFTSDVLTSFIKDFSFIMSQPTRAPSF